MMVNIAIKAKLNISLTSVELEMFSIMSVIKKINEFFYVSGMEDLVASAYDFTYIVSKI